jgi:hypothetical protein
MRIKFWFENLKKRDQLEDIGVDVDNTKTNIKRNRVRLCGLD